VWGLIAKQGGPRGPHIVNDILEILDILPKIPNQRDELVLTGKASQASDARGAFWMRYAYAEELCLDR